MEYITKDENEAIYESHDTYINIHIMIKGNNAIRGILVDQYVAICLPQDVHAPGIGNKQQVQKAVIKVKI